MSITYAGMVRKLRDEGSSGGSACPPTGDTAPIQRQPDPSNVENTQSCLQRRRVHAHLERYVARLEVIYKDRDMRGLYKHLKGSIGLGGRQAGGQQFIKDENGILLRNNTEILKRWARFFRCLLYTSDAADE